MSQVSTAEAAILERMGIDERWKVALLLPSSYDDIKRPHQSVTQLHESTPSAITLTIDGAVSTSGSGGVPRVTFMVADATGGRSRATIFGNAKLWERKLAQGQSHTFLAIAKQYAGQLQVTIKEQIEPQYVGRIRPTYPARRSKTSASLVRATVGSLLAQAIPQAARFVESELGAVAPLNTILDDIGCPRWTLHDLIAQVHQPNDMAYAAHANAAYRRLAALGALARMHLRGPEPRANRPIALHSLNKRIAQMPFKLTSDQLQAVAQIAALLQHGAPIRHVVAGECGSGKTCVGSVVAAAVIDESPAARVLVLVPNGALAMQFRREFNTAFPDIKTGLVTAQSEAEDAQGKVIFGTSAALHTDLGAFDLVIVDEQQNWSRAQREQYVASNTHLIELSATLIPRTQALVKFGKVTVSQMRSTHAARDIRTRLWQGKQGATDLMREVAAVIAKGDPVVVVYPKREATGGDAIPDRYSIGMATPRWERAFPGQVRAITSDDDAAGKQAAIADIEAGRARVLLATTVVQVGLNISGLRNIVIAHPERHGLTGLHQIRGRVARQGGVGYCELLAIETISDKARARLDALMSTTDGFALAEKDLELRGTGDMGVDSQTQSGADQTFLYGVAMSADLIQEVAGMWERYLETPREPTPKKADKTGV